MRRFASTPRVKISPGVGFSSDTALRLIILLHEICLDWRLLLKVDFGHL